MEYTEIFFYDDMCCFCNALFPFTAWKVKNGASVCSEIIMPALSENSVSWNINEYFVFYFPQLILYEKFERNWNLLFLIN